MDQLPTNQVIEDYIDEVVLKYTPEFRLAWKSDSFWMKVGKTIAFWNPNFMITTTTKLFSTIYVPTKWNEYGNFAKISILAHEAVHAADENKNPLNGLLYFFPQVLFLVLAVGLAFVSPWFLFLALLGLLPLPAPFRFWTELRGYRMNLFLLEKYLGWDKSSNIYKETKALYVSHLTGKMYYFTMPFQKFAEAKFNETGWEKEAIYQETLAFCKENSDLL